MAEADLRALLERHVELFNDAVRTGDYRAYLATFAATAVMRFEDVAGGPFHGLAQITQAYATSPPTDTIALIDMQEVGPDAVKASFEWDAGGTGEMVLRWAQDGLVELIITFAG